ncbi:MAG: SWIM zinc finger domain-containing protein [Caldilineaceae bacterium]|nr:SWIM zinc finger domain-containing protein [Caldilineaceae bacterium]
MSTLPTLTESAIRSRASAQSWARGRDYFESDSVDNLIWRDGVLTADVQGSEYEPYHVEINCDEHGVNYASCTCPYDQGGDCKHIIAVLLYLIHQRDSIEARPPLSELIAPLSREQLVTLLTHLTIAHPHLINEIERRLPSVISTAPASAPQSAAKSAPPVIDTSLLQRQIKADLRMSINTGYSSWGEDLYDSDLGAALQPGLQMVHAHLESGDARSALVLLEAITNAWQDGIDSLDESIVEMFEDVADGFTTELGELWAEALLLADLDADERETWADTLDDMAESTFGGSSLLIAITAAEQGWDYPPLKAAMAGHITERGAWEDETPIFAEELALIRLRILAQRREYAAYLNLAQAEGQFMLYLHMLVQQGESDKALAEALEFLNQPTDVHALAKTLVEYEYPLKAIQLAEHGLKLGEEQGKAQLAAWLRDLAKTSGQPDLALSSAQQALTYEASLENYLALQKIAGPKWASLKPEILTIVSRSQSSEGKVDIYLHEGMHNEAIALVDQSRWFYDIDKVIEAVKASHPDWAFKQCRQNAEAIMDAGKADRYSVAVEYLRRGRDILLAAGQQQEWSLYLSKVLEIHQRKYKLVPMLRALRQG